MRDQLTPAEVRSYYRERAPRIQQTNAKELRGPCPIHKGEKDSFAMEAATGRWHCHSECGRGGDVVDLEMALTGADIASAIREVERIVGRPPANDASRSKQTQRIEATYDYRDASGKLLYQVVRLRPKDFRQRRPGPNNDWVWNTNGVSRVLYRLPEVVAAGIVLVVEGEKDTDTVRALKLKGVAATTSSGGAGKWDPAFAEVLRGKRVFVVPDNDEPGRKHALTVVRSLLGVATELSIIEVPAPNKDISDLVKAQPNARAAAEAVAELSKSALVISNGADIDDLAQRWGLTDRTDTTGITHTNGGDDVASSVLSVVSEASDSAEWPDPDPINPETPKVMPFGKELLPASLRTWVLDVVHRMQAVPDFALVSCFLALAITIGRRARVFPKRKDNWNHPLNLWGALVGEPGTRKSAVIAAFLGPIHKIESEWDAEYQRDMQEFQLREARYDADFAKWKRDGSSTPPERPESPRRRRLTTSDATSEAAQILMADNPAGIGIVRDELTGFLRSMEKAGREGERGFWLESWNGTQPFRVDRIGRGPTTVPAACASIVGGIQPDALDAFFRSISTGDAGDGLLQRFQLIVMPEPPSPDSWRYVDEHPDIEAAQQAEHVFRRIVTELNEDEPLHLRFDDGAQEAFAEWLRIHETVTVRDENLSPAHAAHLAKYSGLMPSLAAILHIADAAAGTGSIPDRIGIHHTRQAIALCEYLASHAARLYGSRTSPANRGAQVLAQKIREREIGGGGHLTFREVQRHCWKHLSTREEVQSALRLLEDAAWLRRSNEYVGKGRPSIRYEVNPRVWK